MLPGDPNRSALQNAVAIHEDAIERSSQLLRECTSVSERLDSWKKNSELQQVEDKLRDIRSRFGELEGGGVDAHLVESIANVEAKIEHVKSTKQKAQGVAQNLQEKVAEFNNQALRPLAARIQHFHDVLSPFRFKIEMEASTQRRTTKLRQRVSNQNISSSVSTDPQVELSDGQMAVQGLSTLFAASTEYCWSKWQTLLLDDPLQSSDLLHASAFIDIVRGLVTNLNYQIFLSSHDIEEAKYVIRKCERSGIDVVKCHLLLSLIHI